MSTVKDEERAILDKLPDNCTMEDVQYHLYVVEKIHRSMQRVKQEGVVSHKAVERKFEQWTTR